jgi:hypothetical protein
MENPQSIIQMLVAPVVLISACGLLCLALYNRLAAIVSRARAFNKERVEVLTHLSTLSLEEQTGPQAGQLRRRAITLEKQMPHILKRGRLVRNALISLLFSVLCMLGCSLALGLWKALDWAAWLAVGFFFLGIAAMMAAVLLAIWELLRALDPVAVEHSAMDQPPSTLQGL